jgi:hypothetical protein
MISVRFFDFCGETTQQRLQSYSPATIGNFKAITPSFYIKPFVARATAAHQSHRHARRFRSSTRRSYWNSNLAVQVGSKLNTIWPVTAGFGSCGRKMCLDFTFAIFQCI